METIKTKIEATQQAFSAALQQAHTSDDLEQLRIAYLGRNGQVTTLMSHLKDCSVEEKKVLGPLLNHLKQYVQDQLTKAKESLETVLKQQQEKKTEAFDVTAYALHKPTGSLHVYTHIIEQLCSVFSTMGYQIADGPEVETEYYNFSALNIPEHHPARESHDTFFLMNPGHLLRTHTSSIQIHMMENQGAPLAVFAPGRCYRNEATDATHDFMFTQAEGLLINKDISLAHLLATAKTFLQAIFETNLSIRVRPSYFPFVEPGVEIDASCPFCQQRGCAVCKKSGFIEILGSGLVHPTVLHMSGIDPEKYSGFAFGFGIERIAMIKYGITDIRLFHSSKISFLEQFN